MQECLRTLSDQTLPEPMPDSRSHLQRMSKGICVQEVVMLACEAAGMAAGSFPAEVLQGWPAASQRLGPV